MSKICFIVFHVVLLGGIYIVFTYVFDIFILLSSCKLKQHCLKHPLRSIVKLNSIYSLIKKNENWLISVCPYSVWKPI